MELPVIPVLVVGIYPEVILVHAPPVLLGVLPVLLPHLVRLVTVVIYLQVEHALCVLPP